MELVSKALWLFCLSEMKGGQTNNSTLISLIYTFPMKEESER